MNRFVSQKVYVAILLLALVFFLHAGVLKAQEAPRLDLKTTAEKEVKVKKDGKWMVERVPVEKTGPGDILVFTINYLNRGKTDAVDAAIVNPIPQGVVYVLESAGGKDAEVMCSVDNAVSWHKPPVMIRVKNAEGKEEVKPAPAESYTHVRWTIKKTVPPGQSGRVSFKVSVR
ncbi:MAG: DUF11 domain-containing protein [Deltaproteobacteria bacterium]|nr:DUF11 domain-containing protein [Deltaproteobacteria bacterium]